MTADAQWPEATECLNESGDSPFVLLCEHASNHIPDEYQGLGLDEHERHRHIAWDLGAAEVTRNLSHLLDAPAFLGTYSRLLIDLNRPPGSATSIPVRSEATEIPGNRALSPEERDRRVSRIFTPYHDRIDECLQRRKEARIPSTIIAVHSFTPVFLGNPRRWHAGVLFEKSVALGHSLVARLKADGQLNVEPNVPYSVSRDEDYGLLIHGDDRGNPAVLVEIRNDQLATPAGVEEWVQRLAVAITAAP